MTAPDDIGKTPSIKWKPFQDALPTDADLVGWFGNGRKRNAAMLTGAISNLIMVDGDSDEGLAWMRAHLPLPRMRTRTKKGEHWYFGHPGVRVPNKVRIRTGDPAIKIDVRGDGGYRHRANGACTNALRMSVVEMNEAVLQAVEEHALTPEAIEQVIHLSERDDVTELQGKLARERKDIEKRIARLIVAVEAAGDVASLAVKLRELETRRRAIDVEVTNLQPVPRLAPAVIENRLAEWRRLLRASTTQGRTVLQRILRGRLTFTPREDGQGYDFEGPTRFDKLFTGMVCEVPAWVKAYTGKTGFEDTGPEDTFDGDYGRLLDRAYEKSVKVLASPTGFEPVQGMNWEWRRMVPDAGRLLSTTLQCEAGRSESSAATPVCAIRGAARLKPLRSRRLSR